MVLLTAILSMACVYYGYDTGVVLGFMLALFCEILALILLYNILRRTEERVNQHFSFLLDGQKDSLKKAEALAEKRALVLDDLLRQYPELSGPVAEACGETFPRDGNPVPPGSGPG